MASTLPSNLHAELALDRGRLSHDGPERSGARSISGARATVADPHARVQSLHGVIVEPTQYAPSASHGVIVEEPDAGMLSGAELAAVLDREEEFRQEEDIGTQRAVMHEAEWYEERSPTSSAGHFSAMQDQQSHHQAQQQQQQRPFAPRQSSLNSAASQPQVHSGAYPQSIPQTCSTTLSPPPRSSSSSVPASAPAHQQAFSSRPRFALTDDGPVSAPSSPAGSDHGHGLAGHPAIRRAASDSHPHSHSEPSSPGLSVTPPMRRGGARTQPPTPRYATFEEMGIRGKGIAEAQAEKDAKDCVIM